MSFILLGILNSQAAGAAYPAFLDSAPLWLDAADASTITESGGSVSQWNNKGTGSDFVQAVSSNQPTTGVSSLNGLNVFDFASDSMSDNGLLGEFNFLHNGTPFFIATVVSYTSDGTINGLFGTSAGGVTSTGLTFQFDDRSSAEKLQIFIGNDSSVIVGIEDSGFLDSNFTIHSSIFDPSNSTAANRVDYFKNETAGTVNNSSTAAPSTADSSEKLKIGIISSDTNRFLNGKFAEIIIVSGADATESNRQATVEYLNAKWGLF